MNRVLIFIFFIVSFSVMSQNTLDSLTTLLKNTSAKSLERANLLNRIGLEYWIIDPKISIDYGNEALHISDSLKYIQGQAKANRVLGVAYWAGGNHVNAIKHLDQALKQNTKLNNPEDVANTTLNLAMVYAALRDNDKALKMYEHAIVQFTALNLKSRIATTYTKIGSLYLDENRPHEAKEHLSNALKMHTESNYTYGIAEAHNRLGILYIALNEKEQAYYHIEKSITIGRQVNDKDGMISNLIQYGKLLILDQKFDLAEDHLRLAIDRSKQNNLKRYQLEAYKNLKELKRTEGKFDEALHYYDQYISLKDSLYNSEKAMQIAALEFKNDLDAKEQQLALLTKKEENNRLFQWTLSLGLIGLTITALVFYISYKKQTKQQKDITDSKERLTKTALENAQLKQKELEQQLDYKNKELTSYTLNFVQKNELFQLLKEQIDLLKTATPNQQSKIITNLNRTIRQHINIDKDWEDFKRFFEEVHTNFNEKLKETHPNLSANDLKICALTRLNLNIKESATILGITPESVKTARYRLRKKLELHPTEELLSYFLKLEQA